MSIANKHSEIIEHFNGIEDWDERYKALIDMGKELPSYPEEFRNDKFKIEGCQSQVWLHPTFNNGLVYFEADSDAMIVKGLAALIVNAYSGFTPTEIISNPPDFINKIGIDSHLSPTRKNGLSSMIKQIQMYALAFKALAK